MKLITYYISSVIVLVFFIACSSNQNPFGTSQTTENLQNTVSQFNYVAEQFADLRVLRYQVKGFEQLPLKTRCRGRGETRDRPVEESPGSTGQCGG